MATITDRTRGKTTAPGRRVHLASIRAQLGTRTEAVSAQNFGLRTFYHIFPAPTPLGGSTGTLLYVTVRNPGSDNARASVIAWRLRADGTGTLVTHRITVGTVTAELLALGQ